MLCRKTIKVFDLFEVGKLMFMPVGTAKNILFKRQY